MEERPGTGERINIESIAYDDAKMNIVLYEVGKRIGDERRKRNITREMLAARANMTGNSIYKMEEYQCNPRLKSLLKISCALGVGFNTLVQVESGNRILSNGDKFEQITKNASVSTINHLLNQAKELMLIDL